MIYWDPSVILKQYVSENDSEEWQALALGENKPLGSRVRLLAEMAFALRQKNRAEIETGAAHSFTAFLETT